MFLRKISLALVLAAGFALTTAADDSFHYECSGVAPGDYCRALVAENGGCQCSNTWRTILSATFDGYIDIDVPRSGTFDVYHRWFNFGWSAGCYDLLIDGQYMYTACETDECGGDIACKSPPDGHRWRSDPVELSVGTHEFRFKMHGTGGDAFPYFLYVDLSDANVKGVARTSLWTLEDDIANIALTPGPDGAAGAQGPQGKAGNDGATGATGADGTAGADGDAGAAGAQGPQGKAGADGATGDAAACTSCADVTNAAVDLACKLVASNPPTNVPELQEFAQTIVDTLLISANICDPDNCDVGAGITAAIDAKLNP